METSGNSHLVNNNLGKEVLMKIAVDTEGQNVIHQLCDIALKQGGVQNLAAVTMILNSIQLLHKEEPKKSTKKE